MESVDLFLHDKMQSNADRKNTSQTDTETSLTNVQKY